MYMSTYIRRCVRAPKPNPVIAYPYRRAHLSDRPQVPEFVNIEVQPRNHLIYTRNLTDADYFRWLHTRGYEAFLLDCSRKPVPAGERAAFDAALAAAAGGAQKCLVA